jgi:enoyl-CoA hydratase/carnithine racemase
MLVTGEFIDARTAQQRGLVNRVVPAEHLDAEIGRLVDAIVAKPGIAIAMGKELFYRQIESGVEAAYQMASQTMACNLVDPVAQEGIDAFIAKRKPDWPAGR